MLSAAAPPSGVDVIVNNNNASATSEIVTLSLAATNADECRYINEGESWSTWEAYATTKNWVLTDGAGTKTVYYQCRNEFGELNTDGGDYDTILAQI